jgi:aldehyde:ferredoxin oxidoreductase
MAEKRFGMSGRVLEVDLTSKQFSFGEIPEKDLNQFLGGRGLGAVLLYKKLPAKVDPFDGQNPLIFSTGPLTGTTAPCSSRFCLHTKSPLTGLYLFSISGGHFGPGLKATGFDVLTVRGKAAKPTYLVVTEEGVHFKDASHLWGMTTDDTQGMIKDAEGRDVETTCIGPAGENLVPYACIINERRALGRGGAGAVMGSKNLKAIAVQGRRKTSISDEERFKEGVKRAYDGIRQNPSTSEVFTKLGSASMVNTASQFGFMPARNWQGIPSEEIEKIAPEFMREEFVIRDVPCAPPCPVKCSKFTLARRGNYAGTLTEGPEYETLYSFGSSCSVYDIPTIMAADRFCDRYGLDTISAGVSIAFSMECYEKGIINKGMTDGMELTFGRGEVILPLLHKIAYREGFGEVLSQGTRKMAGRFGKGSEVFAMHAKGMELGGYDPRGVKGMALVFACGARGGCHHAGGYTVYAEVFSGKFDRFAEKGKAKLVKDTRNRRSAACDSGLLCSFGAVGMNDEVIAEMISSATGMEFSVNDIYSVGDRIACLERTFNVREGLTPRGDTLPGRLLDESLSEGPSRNQRVDLQSMLDEFYKECGWDKETGAPTQKKVKELGIEWILER